MSDAESLTSAEMKNWSNDAKTCQEIYDVTRDHWDNIGGSKSILYVRFRYIFIFSPNKKKFIC